jgi:hypothetical protein
VVRVHPGAVFFKYNSILVTHSFLSLSKGAYSMDDFQFKKFWTHKKNTACNLFVIGGWKGTAAYFMVCSSDAGVNVVNSRNCFFFRWCWYIWSMNYDKWRKNLSMPKGSLCIIKLRCIAKFFIPMSCQFQQKRVSNMTNLVKWLRLEMTQKSGMKKRTIEKVKQ